MHILKRVLFPLILVGISFTACSPGGPLTPNRAFEDVKQAFVAKDGPALYRLLSKEGQKKVDAMAADLAGLKGAQQQRVARHYGLTPEKMKNLTGRTFASLYLEREAKGVLGKALARKVVNREHKGKRALILLEGGPSLLFVQEGPYWRFDLKGL